MSLKKKLTKKQVSLKMEDIDPTPPAAPPVAPTPPAVGSAPVISLHKAAKDGDVAKVRRWMTQCGEAEAVKVNARDADGYTAFHLAAKHNRLAVLRILAGLDRQKGDPSVTADHKLCTETERFTALHLAAYHRQRSSKAVMELLVNDLKMDVNKKAQYDAYPLHVACSRGNKDAVDVLLTSPAIQLNLRDASNDTILHEACTTDNIQLLTVLLKELEKKGKLCELLAVKNDTNHTPLHVAFSYGHPTMAQKLIEFAKKVDCKAHMDEENPPLMLACSHGEQTIATDFLKIEHLELDVYRQGDHATILHLVAERGWDDAMVEILKTRSCLLNRPDKCKRTPLHYAAANSKNEFVELLMNQDGIILDAVDEDGRTPLLVAASRGYGTVLTTLKCKADMCKRDNSGKNAVLLAAESDEISILRIAWANKKELFDVVDLEGNTPLHAAAAHGSDKALEEILSNQPNPYPLNYNMKTPLHLAAENGHKECVKKLLEKPPIVAPPRVAAMGGDGEDEPDGRKRDGGGDPGAGSQDHEIVEAAAAPEEITVTFKPEVAVDWTAEDDDSNNALHLAARKGHTAVVRSLLDKDETNLIRARNQVLWTPLDYAAFEGHKAVVELLIDRKAEVDSKDKYRQTPLHLAAKRGHVSVVLTLLKHGADLKACDTKGANALDFAIENGHVSVAMAIVKSDGWRQAMCHVTKSKSQSEETTPMRKLIKKMPEVATEVLNRCTAANDMRPDDPNYAVTFDYEFLEDFRNDPVEQNLIARLRPSHIVASFVNRFVPKEKRDRFSTDWGPHVFNKNSHPLNIMVECEQTKLLDHPLVSRLIAFKWSRAWPLYLLNVLFYAVFLIALTVFALRLPNPQSSLCLSIANGTFGNASDSFECQFNSTGLECGQCNHHSGSLIAAGIVVILCVSLRLTMELFQLLQLNWAYFLAYDNWVEVILYTLVLIFMTTLGETCICAHSWQWQIGALTIFLAWIHLSIFIRKLPLFGLYIVMFQSIVWTFVRIAIPAFLLVLAFTMSFYMLFFVPNPLYAASPFATPGLSIIKAMTMSAGEVDYNSIFQLTSEGAASEDEVLSPIPYPVSFLIWIFFLILMPILLMNLLTSLAVDDVGQIRSNAEHRKLELQIELVLNTEEALQVMRWRFVREKETITPNSHSQALKKIRSLLFTGVDDNFTADNIVKTLNKTPSEPIEYVLMHCSRVVDKMEELSRDLKVVKRKNRRMERLLDKLADDQGVGDDVDGTDSD